jgi:hypothetical protein
MNANTHGLKNGFAGPSHGEPSRVEQDIAAAVGLLHNAGDEVRAIYIVSRRRPADAELNRIRERAGRLEMTADAAGCVEVRRPAPELAAAETPGAIDWQAVRARFERARQAAGQWLARRAQAFAGGFTGLHEGVR